MQGFLALAAKLQMSRQEKTAAVVFGILTLFILAFIWVHSMLPRAASAEESSALMRWIKPIVDPANKMDDASFHHNLRKAAHFIEYAALGFCICGFYRNLKWKRKSLCTFVIILSPILAASIDESIQIFAQDRGPRLSDVLLDSCGALCGIGVFLFLAHCFRSILKKN